MLVEIVCKKIAKMKSRLQCKNLRENLKFKRILELKSNSLRILQ